nr:GM01069p [Drosophila melanogaster]
MAQTLSTRIMRVAPAWPTLERHNPWPPPSRSRPLQLRRRAQRFRLLLRPQTVAFLLPNTMSRTRRRWWSCSRDWAVQRRLL